MSWQITPRALIAAIADPAAAKRVFAAMMGKIDIAAIEAARRDSPAPPNSNQP